jgi:hypothetical protein
VSDLASTTNGMVVRWSSELGRSYVLASSTNLIDDDFSTMVESGIDATPPVNEYIDGSTPVSNRFYRIEVE